MPYYPPQLGSASEDILYLALAQVRDGRNLAEGIEQLSRALAHSSSPRPEFYMGLGDAWHSAGDPAKAATAYRQAVKLRPDSAPASRYLGIALYESGQPASATAALTRAIELDPSEARAWLELALISSETGRNAEALADIQKAAALDPDLPDIWNALGTVAKSEDAFRRALRIDPYYASASGNLAGC
jgi:Flp pilus assembly protein TadD